MGSFFTGDRWGLRGNFAVEEILFLQLLGGALVTIPIMLKIGFLVRKQGLILFGALLVRLWQIIIRSDAGGWKGYLLFLFGAGLFSIYTIYFRQSGLSPTYG